VREGATAPLVKLMLYVGAKVVLVNMNRFSHLGVSHGSKGTFVGCYPPLAELECTTYNDVVGGCTVSVQNVERLPELFFVHVPGATRLKLPGLPPQVIAIATTAGNRSIEGFEMVPRVRQATNIRPIVGTTLQKLQSATADDGAVLGTLRPKYMATEYGPLYLYTALSRMKQWADVSVVPAVATGISLDDLNMKLPDDLRADVDRLEDLARWTMLAMKTVWEKTPPE
jgi:hypothetical protein